MISGLWILCDLWHESGDYPRAPGTDPVHVFLTWKRKWKGCYIVTLQEKYFWKSYERFFYSKWIIRGFISPALLEWFWRWCQWMFLFVLHFSVHFTFPQSLSVLVFRLKLSHCLVKTNLKEQQFWWEVKFSISIQFVLTYLSIVAALETIRRQTDVIMRIWHSLIHTI